MEFDSQTSVLDFIRQAGNTAIDFYRVTQGQDPLLRDESGAVTGTTTNQMMMMIVLMLAVVMVITLIKK